MKKTWKRPGDANPLKARRRRRRPPIFILWQPVGREYATLRWMLRGGPWSRDGVGTGNSGFKGFYIGCPQVGDMKLLFFFVNNVENWIWHLMMKYFFSTRPHRPVPWVPNLKRVPFSGSLDAWLSGYVAFLFFPWIGDVISYKCIVTLCYICGTGKWSPEGSEGLKIKGVLKIIKWELKILALPPTFWSCA